MARNQTSRPITSLYADVTDRIIRELEAGRLPWVQPWDGWAGMGLPRNAATGRRYSGINVLILWDRLSECGYVSQRWLTYRQAQALGGNVRKGEQGTTVCYADRFTPKAQAGAELPLGDDERQRQIAFLKRFIARGSEYRVLGVGRDGNGRQVVRLVDENGRVVRWDPRTARATQISVFQREERDLAQGDRIQWRLANKSLDLKNAERGTVEKLDGTLATIRWDRDKAVKVIDLAEHRTWDHGYAETVYSAQSKTYARAYVLAPVSSGLVNGQNYYTAITRARFGVKLWTEDEQRLAEKLETHSGEKTSALEGLGRLDRDGRASLAARHADHIDRARAEQDRVRSERRDAMLERQIDRRGQAPQGLPGRLAENAHGIANILDRFLQTIVDRVPAEVGRPDSRPDPTPVHSQDSRDDDAGHGPEH